ncbi:microtubule-associated protein futsch isoform X2 [Manihot esculenta]|uniref:microtubule-associated protein futsch isoform X2 n=1 Tax=Manihot esculenta TaxID=3983 RepID=UPI000B5D0ABB|nr:microtubule-associated protein futsch isoform X2 [Manihot esculenta]
MATESETTSLHNPTTTVNPDEPMENKVNQEVMPMEQETVSFPEGGKEENPKFDELPRETKQLKGESNNKQTEPPEIEVKIDGSSAVDALLEDKIEMEQDIPHSHAHSSLEPAGDAVKSQPVAQPANESVAEVQEEQPATASVEKIEQKQPTIVDISESSAEAVEKPEELSAVVPTKESEEVVVRDPEDSEVVSKGVNKQETVVSEVAVKVEEQSEVTEHSAQPESVSEIGKQQEPPAVLAIRESEAVVKDIEASEAASKETDEPESVVPELEATQKEQSEVAKQDERVESIEATEKQQESLEVLPVKESEAVVINDIEDSAVPENVDKPESVVPAEVEMKPEEQSEVIKVDEKPESPEAEADIQLKVGYEVPENIEIKSIEKKTESSVLVDEVKPEDESEVSGQVEPKGSIKAETVIDEGTLADKVEIKSIKEKTEPVVPVVEVKPEHETEVIGQVEPKGSIKAETVIDEGTLADKVVDTIALKEERTSKEEEPSAASEQIVLVKQEAEADLKEGIEESSLADGAETTDLENGKKETDGTEVVEAPPKKAIVQMENDGQEREEKTIKSEVENAEREELNKGLNEPIKVDDFKAAVSNTEITERSFEGEQTGQVIEPLAENKKEENIKEKTPALVETSKDGSIEGKLDEAITAVTEPVNKSPDSGLEVKDEESAKTGEGKVGKENAEIEKSDTQNLEPPTEDGDDAKASQDLPREVPAKPIQNMKEDTPALVETSKDGSIEGKLDEAIRAITEPVNKSQGSGLEVKDEGSAKSGEGKVGKEDAEEIAKSDALYLEPSIKDGDDAKASQDLPREVPAKPIQKIKKENTKEGTPALVETSKDGFIGGKLDEAITAVTEPVNNFKDSGLEAKDEESAKASEGKVGKENVEEIAKSEAWNLESSTKDGDDAKASQGLPREIPAKPIQKQSNNILTKMKHSLVKAKKAIIGKSTSSKTLSSDTKGDIKVK